MALVPRLAISRAILQGDLNPVGMTVSSMLTEVQFQVLNGTDWILADGRSIVGSAYATVTGLSVAPDCRGRTIAGRDDMGGVAAGLLTSTSVSPNGNTVGATGGTQTHALTTAQLAAHGHNILPASGALTEANNATARGFPGLNGATGGYVTNATAAGLPYIQNSGSGSAHPNTQPTIVMNTFIKIN